MDDLEFHTIILLYLLIAGAMVGAIASGQIAQYIGRPNRGMIHLSAYLRLKSVKMDSIRVQDVLKEYSRPRYEIETRLAGIISHDRPVISPVGMTSGLPTTGEVYVVANNEFQPSVVTLSRRKKDIKQRWTMAVTLFFVCSSIVNDIEDSSSSLSTHVLTYKINQPIFTQPMPKICTTHTYITRNIHGDKPAVATRIAAIDDITLPRGESVGPALLKTIQESHIAVIIFSKNYADSSWCLDELVHIMKCRNEKGQIVLPVFYDVDPSEVRNQKGDFGKAFAKQKRKNVNKVISWRNVFAKQEAQNTKVDAWKKALVDASNISGWEPKNVANGHESMVIKKIVDAISNDLLSLNSDVDDDLVGMTTRLQDLISQLEIGTRGVRMVGIWGVGGGGKTTLANSVYMKIAHQFDGHCLIDNIREESSKQGFKTLQEKLLSTILKRQVQVQSIDEGRKMIKNRLCQNNVLIVLDDVDDRKQLEALAGSHNWFGDGSRIIITTRDEHLLTSHLVDHVSRVTLLSNDEAICLFNRYAYNEKVSVNDYVTLSFRVVSYAAGLPLALKVLGSYLNGRDEKEWISTLDRLKDIPESEILEQLKISYDGLKAVEKELFLDIACLWRGERKDDAMEMFEACGFHPLIGIRVLIQKALITLDSLGRFDMHDLVQEMGHHIVRWENPNNPQKHTRVWKDEEINYMCLGNTTTENDITEAIRYHVDCPSSRFFKVVSNMKKLRCLTVTKKKIGEADNDVEGPTFLSNELRYINWVDYPASPFPDSFQPMNLSSLKLLRSLQKQLWKGNKHLPHLKVLRLICMDKLVSTPDFDGLPCLQTLELSSCYELEEIHRSLGNHRSLKNIEVTLCSKLKMFPTIVQMEKLETLEIKSCHKSLEFPEIQANLESLVKLYLDRIGIQDLLSSIGERCTSLITLYLNYCFIMKSIKVNFDGLKHLKIFEFRGITRPEKTPLYFHQFIRSLQKLDLTSCQLEDGEIPSHIGELLNLQELCLGGNDFTRLPFSIVQLTRLKRLYLSRCQKLVELPELPSSIAILFADSCAKLKPMEDFHRNCKWLCKVVLIEGGIAIDGNRLLQSMLQGSAIENRSMSLGLQGVDIPKGFTPRLHVGWRCTLQLPDNWCDDFCGFLVCAVVTDECSHVALTMKQAMSDSMGMDSQDDVLWEESVNDDERTWVWYITFGSLRDTKWWNPTYNKVLFSLTYQISKLRGFGVTLVRRKSGSGPVDTLTDSSEFSGKEDDYTCKFDISDSIDIHDDSTNILRARLKFW
ncbi:toll/interleukin-1 receptor (TIR) domain-containing protein [Artemisia annua]|uniref:ADP-ribosyl cyclase/cyclic ADP-ribose hydrolase n=1 Tax=Artemisia annua TaxID=35608 RepID=A0A2U1PPB3_ARTAN|nr:toll/interleukin-1 receptor (TIR) domain-containing protein [Artemisia annua]